MSVVTAPPEPPSAPPAADPAGLPPEPPRGGIAKRLLLGCLLVVIASAVATAVFVNRQISTLRDALSQNPSLDVGSGLLANAGFGSPQTLLLVGNDQRAHTTTAPVLPHSNEMLLVRIDPSKPWISMMSIPRELWVPIYPPGQPAVTTRFNYAYTAGGIPLLVSTIKRILGLSVNHVIVIDFNQFRQAVDEMGCVYSTVDRRYYHINTPTSEQYQEIDLQPGYQKLCGTQALQFVSYRHGDTSLVRDARNQSFLLDVKREYGPTLTDNVDKFEHIFGQTVQTDPGLHTTTGILNLLGTLISSSARRVRQVQFQVNLFPTYDTATPQQIAASVHSFLHGGSALPKQSVAAVAPHAVAHLPLAATSSERARARAAGANLPFPLEYPRVQDQLGDAVPVALRDYQIQAPGGAAYPAYVAVFSAGILGQNYDVQGMTWTTAPQFDNPDQTVHLAGRTYYLDYEGQHVETVAWYEHGAVYWIRNTLLDSIGNGELVAIAEQTTPLTAGGPGQPRVTLKGAAVPAKPRVATQTGLIQNLGSLGGLLTLAALPLLTIPLIKRRRELKGLRAQLRDTARLEAELTAATAHATGGPPYEAGRSPGVYTKYAAAGSSAVARLRPRGPLIAGAGVATVAAAGALLLLLTGTFEHTNRITVSHHAASSSADAVPTVPVAVLNATSTHGSAGRLAGQIRARGVKIAGVGNLSESRPPGLWILYAPGARTQAARLARLLDSRSPTIAPIDPVAQAAAGPATKVVAVIA